MFCSIFMELKGGAGKDDKDADRDPAGHKKENLIKVPKIYWKYTRKGVLTMEWINGIKLTDEKSLARAHLERKELIDQVSIEIKLLLGWLCYTCNRNN